MGRPCALNFTTTQLKFHADAKIDNLQMHVFFEILSCHYYDHNNQSHKKQSTPSDGLQRRKMKHEPSSGAI